MDLNRFKPVAKCRLVYVLHFTDLLAQLNLLVLEGGGGGKRGWIYVREFCKGLISPGISTGNSNIVV